MNITCTFVSHVHVQDVPVNSNLNWIHTKMDAAIEVSTQLCTT